MGASNGFISLVPLTLIAQWFNILLLIALVVLGIYLLRLLIGFLRGNSRTQTPYQSTAPYPPIEKAEGSGISFSAALKQQRIRCGMTQEAVAEALSVSRQAVSKWENGTSEPSTANLLALAKLYGVSVEELLQRKED